MNRFILRSITIAICGIAVVSSPGIAYAENKIRFGYISGVVKNGQTFYEKPNRIRGGGAKWVLYIPEEHFDAVKSVIGEENFAILTERAKRRNLNWDAWHVLPFVGNKPLEKPAEAENIPSTVPNLPRAGAHRDAHHVFKRICEFVKYDKCLTSAPAGQIEGFA